MDTDIFWHVELLHLLLWLLIYLSSDFLMETRDNNLKYFGFQKNDHVFRANVVTLCTTISMSERTQVHRLPCFYIKNFWCLDGAQFKTIHFWLKPRQAQWLVEHQRTIGKNLYRKYMEGAQFKTIQLLISEWSRVGWVSENYRATATVSFSTCLPSYNSHP